MIKEGEGFTLGITKFQASGGTILSSPFFIEIILPFLLIFVIVFAILQKSKVLGDGKKQIDAIVALVIGLIVVAFGYATSIIVALIPFLAVSAVIILTFLILYSLVYKEGEFQVHRGLKIAFGVVIGIAVIIAVLLATGAWEVILDTIFYGESGGAIFTNVLFLVIIGVAVAVVMYTPKNDKKSDS